MKTEAQAALVLIVDDEVRMRRYLQTLLDGSGHRVIEVATAGEALVVAAARNPDVILLDLGLPDQDGMEVIRRLREWTRVPIIVISARDQESAKVEALDLGADDYLTKPFGAAELLARIRAHLRRAPLGVEGSPQAIFSAAHLKIDYAKREVFVDDQVVSLTPIEYKLLVLLSKHVGRVLTHRQILKEVWGPNNTEHEHYVRVYITHLRRKLERDPAQPTIIITEQSVGYRLRVP